MSGTIRAAFFSSLLVAVLSTVAGASDAEEGRRAVAADPSIDVRYQAGKLSVTSTASLGDVLAKVRRVTGIKITFETAPASASQQVITAVAFQSLPIEDAFRRILRHNNFILVYSGANVREVKIYGDGTPGQGGGATAAPPQALSKIVRKPVLSPPVPVTPTTQEPEEETPAALRSAALDDPDPTRRIDALSQLTDETARDTALEMLARERDPDVLETVLDVLRGQESVSVDALVRFASAAPTPALRSQAITIMGEQGQRSPQMLSFLRRAANDADEDVRETAKQLLEDLEQN